MTAPSEEVLVSLKMIGLNSAWINGPDTTERMAGTLPADGDGQLDRRGRWQHGKRKRVPWLRSSRRASIDERLRKGQEGERRDKEERILDADREAQVQHARADHVEEAVRRLLAVADLGGSAVEGLEHEMQATAVMFDGEFWSTDLASRDLVKRFRRLGEAVIK